MAPLAIGALPGFFEKFEERLDDVDRHWEHNGGILFAADLGQALQVMKLHGSRYAGQNLCGVDEGLRSLKLGFGVYDLGAAIAFGFGLLGDRPCSRSARQF